MTPEIMAHVAKETVGTHFHPIGTCAMKALGIGGVVNEQLVVYGTANLRVADASIFRMHVQGNTMYLTYAVAEKAADLIKADQIRTYEYSTTLP
jgi:choline dehydrogenase